MHYPAGIASPCHYLKHAKARGPNALRRVPIPEKTTVGEYLAADSIEAVLSLAQMGIVELHTWNSTALTSPARTGSCGISIRGANATQMRPAG